MTDFTSLDLNTLVDMLARHTAEYMRMLKEGTTQEEYAACKELINELSAEIEIRKQKKNQTGKKEASIKKQ